MNSGQTVCRERQKLYVLKVSFQRAQHAYYLDQMLDAQDTLGLEWEIATFLMRANQNYGWPMNMLDF